MKGDIRQLALILVSLVGLTGCDGLQDRTVNAPPSTEDGAHPSVPGDDVPVPVFPLPPEDWAPVPSEDAPPPEIGDDAIGSNRWDQSRWDQFTWAE